MLPVLVVVKMPKQPQPLNEPDPLIGKTLAGRFLVKSLIDRGGMGKIYRAEQQPLGRAVALKTLDLLDPNGEFRERFFNEASIASKLTHPNTVRIFDYGRSDEGVYFLTMELLDGRSLQKVVKSEAPIAPLRLIPIARQVCGALHEAHEQGIVHRDLKPGNIFLTKHGEDQDEFAKVLDFGLVKDLDSDVNLSQTGQALGSPLYMSPEQVEGEKVDRRSDIYSMGLVLYVALTGRVPFKRGSVATIMMQQVTGTIPTFDEILPGHSIPPSLEWVVRRCVEKKRDDRIATMRELSRALKLCERELRGELEQPIDWKLDGRGLLTLDPSLMTQEDTNLHRSAELLKDIPDIPTSPTLNRSVSTVAATGAALAGGGLLLAGGAIVVVAVLLLIGIGVVFMNQEDAVPPPPEPVVEVAPPVETPPPPEPVEAAVQEVEIRSEPAGAEVLKDGRMIGSTPMTLKVGEEPVELTLQLDGHKPKEILADGTVETLNVRLKKAAVRSPKPAPSVAPAPVPVPSPKPVPAAPVNEIRDPWEDE